MNKYLNVASSTAIALVVMLSGCVAGSSKFQDQHAVMSYDGLVQKSSERNRVVYLKENVDWSEYKNIQLLASQVAFRKNWQRDQNQSIASGRVKDGDVLRIKQGVAELFDETMRESITESPYKLVESAEENTLLLRPAVIDLDVNAPDLMSAGRSTTFVRSAGSATLYLEVFDAVSGEIVARILDYDESRDRGYSQWANRVTNRAEAQRIMMRWSDRLVKGLQQAQAIAY